MARIPGESVNLLLGRLLKAWKQRWLTPCKAEMPVAWQMVKKGIERLREVDMLEWIYYMRPEDPTEDDSPWESPGEMSLTSSSRVCL